MNLGGLWEGLEQEAAPERPLLRQQSVLDGLHCAVAAGLRWPGARRVLILRLGASQARTLLQRGMTPSLTLSRLPDDQVYPGQISIEMASPVRQHQELFALIGGDLAEQLTDDPRNAGQVILDRLDLWREFLRRREDGDTERWARGLFGELWYLAHEVLPNRPGDSGIGCWQGPAGAAHDFVLGACSVDVKTGTVGSETIHIASLQQLTPPPGSGLLLGHIVLRRDGQGQTLRELVAALYEQLPVEVRPLLDSRLLAAGYHESDAGLLDTLRLVVQELRLYQVTPGFPALVPANVPSGVEQCSYTIRLAACHPFHVPSTYPWTLRTETATPHGQ